MKDLKIQYFLLSPLLSQKNTLPVLLKRRCPPAAVFVQLSEANNDISQLTLLF